MWNMWPFCVQKIAFVRADGAVLGPQDQLGSAFSVMDVIDMGDGFPKQRGGYSD